MKKTNTIRFQFPGTSENNYQPEIVDVTPRNGQQWTREDIESHMKIAGFSWDDPNLKVEPVMASYGHYADPVPSTRLYFNDVVVTMPNGLGNMWAFGMAWQEI